GNLGIRDVFVRDLATGQVSIASLTDGEAGANGASSAGALSGDGRYVAFVSLAGNLVAGDTNGSQDVFLRDRVGLTTTLVSVATSGGPGSAGSYGPAISADGRYVAFWSYAPNLVAGDTNGCGDVFVRDRQSGTTELVSISTAGLQGDESSYDPDISADGRYVAFRSEATNLVAGDTNTLQDLFVHDRVTHETTRVSVASGGGQVAGTFYPPTISADGRRIAFAALACDLAPGPCQGRQIYLHDRQENLTIRVSAGLDGTADRGEAWDAALRADGERVVFSTEAANLAAGDANGLRDVYLWSLVVQLDGFEDGSLCGWSGIWGGAPCG
ncbi:MAG: PD40 domain-containing protein, partial [Thermoanaerobaculia bacterium]|nr:PD40 domain-containing protein [Thermoanaerobaculia bacterium]